MTSTHQVTARALLTLAILAALLLSSAGFSAAQGPQPAALFSDAAPPAGYKVPANTLRARFARANLALLGAANGQGRVDSAPDLWLNLFNDAGFATAAGDVVSRAKGRLVWQGQAKGVPNSTITLAVNQGAMAGSIHLGDQLYKVEYAGQGVHVVRQVGLAEPMPVAPPLPVSLPRASKLQSSAALADTGDVIDVMVVYTPVSRAQNGGTAGMVAKIELAVAETNQAYANSQIFTQLNLVHTAEVNYTESSSMSTDLNRLTSKTDGYMDEVHGWRDTYKADMVNLFEENTDYCGIAWLMSSESPSFESYAFSVVDSDCATGYYTFGHELGHNQGSHHDRANAGSSPAYPYSYGYWAPDYSFRTVMAYNCPGGCTRIQYFSNPNVSYSGTPTGIDYGVDPANAADNARSLNETKDTVANWRDSGASPPAAPSNLVATAVSQTQIDLTWTDNASNEDGFRIERSPDGSSWTQIATVGANATAFSNTGLQASTWYDYRIRAYNEVGNSGYSNVASARTDDPPQPPAAPSNLAATATSQTEIDLTWTDNSDNEDGFEIERALDQINWSVIATLGANATSYSDGGLQHSSTYFYQVRAFNGAGYSGYSNMAEATTPSPPPYIDQSAGGEISVAGNVSGSYLDTLANGDGTWQTITERESGGKPSKRYTYLEHKWTFEVQAGSAVTFFANAWAPASSDGDQFVFAYSIDNANYVETFTVTATYDDDSYQTFALPPSTSGTVYVRVTDTDQTPSHREQDSVSVDHLFIRTELEPGDPPAAPTNLAATAISASQIDLSWTDNAENELGFHVERSLDGSSWTQIDAVGADTSAYSDSGLQPSTTYHYRVRAYNGSGNSSYSNTASATTEQAGSIHVGDLDALSTWAKASRWNAEVTIGVHDANEALVNGARVIGVWGDGASGGGECTTDGTGTCTVSKSNIKSNVGSVTFTITSVELAPYSYDTSSNHDPDGDSNGTWIQVLQPS